MKKSLGILIACLLLIGCDAVIRTALDNVHLVIYTVMIALMLFIGFLFDSRWLRLGFCG